MTSKQKNNIYIIIITFVFLILSIFLFGKSGNMLIDFSREIFVPFELNNNKTLIKDIFLIYGFFGYAINSFLYKIYPNLNILLLVENFLALFTTILFYYIARNYIKAKYALILTIFFITTSIFSNSTFNFVVPYSFSTLYAIFGIYLVLFSLLYKKNNLLFLALGLILTCKIELFIPSFLLSILFLVCKKRKFKKNALLILIFPVVNIIYFYANNINLDDIIFNLNQIKQMVNTKAIVNLYKSTGTFFELNYFKYNLIQLCYFLLALVFAYVTYKKNYKILAFVIFASVLFFLDLNKITNLFAFLITFEAIYLYFKNKIKTKEIMLLFFSLILCSKNIFAINSLSYANFGFIFVILTNFLFLSKIVSRKFIATCFLILLVVLNLKNIKYNLENKKSLLKTPKGSIYLAKDDFEIFRKTYDFIIKDTTKNDSLLVVPEGQIFNFITERKYDFYNTTFTPLDFETFGEEKLINDLKNNKTKYIILYPRNTIDYGSATICYDYGENFCLYIADNYERIKIIEDKYKVLIFKLRK